MTPNFYRAFEEKHRGSRELIRGRLQVYHPFVQPLTEFDSDCTAIDLGCGRGEWLEVLQEWGVKAHGVDMDQGMLDAARELQLSVEKCDAIAYLEGLADESQNIVSGFHIAEHLAFEELQILVREALRVLKPAGLLILETPNPENLRVGTVTFYLDPTHKRPIPPELLSFLPEHYGYFRSKVLRLQESQELAEAPSPELLNILNGVSPDYAVVGQKIASPDLLARFDGAFARDYGLSLEELAKRYEAKMQDRFSVVSEVTQRDQTILSLNQVVAERDRHVESLNRLMAERDAEIEKLNRKIAEYLSTLSLVNQAMEDPLNDIRELQREVRERDAIISDLSQTTAEQIAAQKQILSEGEEQIACLNQNVSDRDQQIAILKKSLIEQKEEIEALIQSRSWSITRPLRVFANLVRQFRKQVCAIPFKFLRVVRQAFKGVLVWAISFIKTRPVLKSVLLSCVRRVPRIYILLKRVSHSSDAQFSQPEHVIFSETLVGESKPKIALGHKGPFRPTPAGIHTNQRTPLETHFHTYGEME